RGHRRPRSAGHLLGCVGARLGAGSGRGADRHLRHPRAPGRGGGAVLGGVRRRGRAHPGQAPLRLMGHGRRRRARAIACGGDAVMSLGAKAEGLLWLHARYPRMVPPFVVLPLDRVVSNWEHVYSRANGILSDFLEGAITLAEVTERAEALAS